MTSVTERRVLENEFEWLLGKEYQLRVDAISTRLQECTKKLSDASNSAGDPRPILLQSDSALCTATIEGDRIVKAEINLKLSGRGSRPVHTTIKEHQPWKLKQIQDASNYLNKASKWLEEMSSARNNFADQTRPPLPKSEGGKGEEEEVQKREPAEIRKAFEELTTSLRKAESSLVLPQPITAVQIYNSEQKAVLRPSLPEDTLLHFHICSATLVLTVLTVSQVNKSQHTSRSGTVQNSATYWMGSTFEHGSNLYEVSHQVQTASLVPWLSAMLTLIEVALELAQDFIDKVQVFETMGLKHRS